MIPSRTLKRLLFRCFPLVILFALIPIALPFISNVGHAQSMGSIKTDRAVYAEPPLPARPRAGGKYTDPVFGTEIMRVTDETDEATVGCSTFYSHWPTFNSNSTRLLIRKGENGAAMIKNFDPLNFSLGSTVRSSLPALPGGYSASWESATWHPSDPDIIYTFPLYYDGGMKLYSYNVVSNSFTLLRDFSSLSSHPTDYLKQMYVSADGDVFGWLHMSARTGSSDVHAYLIWRKSTNTILAHTVNTYVGGINEIHVDKSGRYVTIHLNQVQPDNSRTRFLDVQTGRVEFIYMNATDRPSGHGDLGRGIIVGADFYTAGIHLRPLDDIHHPRMQMRFVDAAGNTDWTQDFHGTMLADDESWITIGTYDDPSVTSLPDSGVYEDEIIQAALDDSGRFRRILHTRSQIDNQTSTSGYWAMPKPSISKDGRYIAYTSNWEKSGRYDLFIAKVTPPESVSTNPTPSPTPTTTPTPTPIPTATPTPTPTATPTPTPTTSPTPISSLASPTLVSNAYANASVLAAGTNPSAQQINSLATSIQEAYAVFYGEATKFTSSNQIDSGLRAALYFSRAAAALTSANAPLSGVQNRLRIAATQLGAVKNLMQPVSSSLTFGETAHAVSATTTPVIGTGDIRSSASFAPAISPGSLGTILGNPALSPLSSKTSQAQQSANGSLPYELAGVSVTIGGRAAPLIAVAPSQVNFYIPADVATGPVEFLITTQDGYVSQGTAHIFPATAVPAIFTTNGIGTGTGMVLNAMTRAQGSFEVKTQANLGADKQTRLMIMATGISAGAANKNTANDIRSGGSTVVNFAESVAVEAHTRAGRTYVLPVEYAGASGLLPGLEQVNVRLLPELKGAGDVTLTIIVGSERSNAATVFVR